MNAQDARQHMVNIKDQLSHLLFHKETLTRKIELLKPIIESKIVLAKKTTDLRNISNDDLNVDVVPIGLANMETVRAREEFYYANNELASISANIESLKTVYKTYQDHIADYLKKSKKTYTEQMIFDLYHQAQELKNLQPEEKVALSNIGSTLLASVNGGQEKRMEIYETLENLIKQHS